MGIIADGETYLYDPFHYLVLNSYLQIEPALVRRVPSDMLERHTIVPASPRR